MTWLSTSPFCWHVLTRWFGLCPSTTAQIFHIVPEMKKSRSWRFSHFACHWDAFLHCIIPDVHWFSKSPLHRTAPGKSAFLSSKMIWQKKNDMPWGAARVVMRISWWMVILISFPSISLESGDKDPNVICFISISSCWTYSYWRHWIFYYSQLSFSLISLLFHTYKLRSTAPCWLWLFASRSQRFVSAKVHHFFCLSLWHADASQNSLAELEAVFWGIKPRPWAESY